MAETQKASIGWGGEFWMHDGTTLKELVQVVSFTLPQDEIDDVETTHLKSPDRRREFIAGMRDGGEISVVMNYRPLSDTDELCRDAMALGDVRPIRFVIPQGGVAAAQVDTTGYVRGYDRGEVTADGKMEATLTIKISGAETQVAAE